MSLRAKIEAVIYAAEEPVTLAQLASLFSPELPAAPPEDEPSVESLIEQAFIEADPSLTLGLDHMVEVARLTGLAERQQEQPGPDAAVGEAEAKRAIRQREREVRE